MKAMAKPFDLNLRHLRALSEAAAKRSLNRASEAVGLSQPALTQGLGKIERQLGVRLFERYSNGVEPTAAGIVMAERASRAFDVLGAAVRGGGRTGPRGFARPEWLMTATQLEAFLHFADAQGFAAAATASGLSQPAIHRAVRELEQICGAPLAERRGRGMMMTQAGRALARGVRLAGAEIAAGIADARGDGAEGVRIAVGAMPLSRAVLLPRALGLFLNGASAPTADIVEGSWRELVELLQDGIIDLTVGALREDPPKGLMQKPLFTDQLAIFGRKGHPLATARPIDPAMLATQAWVVGSRGTPLRAHWEALFRGVTPPAVPVECGSVMVIRGLLVQSDLLTLLSPDQVALEVQAGVLAQIGSALPGTVRTIGITTRTDWHPTVAQRQFLEALEQASLEVRNQETQ